MERRNFVKGSLLGALGAAFLPSIPKPKEPEPEPEEDEDWEDNYDWDGADYPQPSNDVAVFDATSGPESWADEKNWWGTGGTATWDPDDYGHRIFTDPGGYETHVVVGPATVKGWACLVEVPEGSTQTFTCAPTPEGEEPIRVIREDQDG